MNHRNALELRLSNERNALAKAKTTNERALRKVWIAQIEKEIQVEKTVFEPELTDDELLEALTK